MREKFSLFRGSEMKAQWSACEQCSRGEAKTDESFISVWRGIARCRLLSSSSPSFMLPPPLFLSLRSVCPSCPHSAVSVSSVEVRCWPFQSGHVMPVCHRWCLASGLCGRLSWSHAGETGISGCTGQLWSQTHQHCQVSGLKCIYLLFISFNEIKKLKNWI